MNPMSAFTEALAKHLSRAVIGSPRSSSEWADVPVGLRDRAAFSARAGAEVKPSVERRGAMQRIGCVCISGWFGDWSKHAKDSMKSGLKIICEIPLTDTRISDRV